MRLGISEPTLNYLVQPYGQSNRFSAPDSVVCPICSGESLMILHRFTAKSAAEAFLPLRRDERRHMRLLENIEKLWQGPVCHVVQCEDCRFGFPVPYVAGDRDFYELAYGVPSYPGHRWEYGRAMEFLRSVSQSDTPRILELGAGVGRFISALLRIPNFRPDRIVATDYSSYSVNALRRLGVNAQLSSVFDLATSVGNCASFDAVCAFQSIEHMANVMEVIFILKKMVKPGGLMILSVPHGPSIEFNERRLSCFDMPPNHVARWYRKSFEVLAEKARLELVAYEIEPWRLLQILRDVMQLHIRGVAASNPESLAGRAQRIENRSLRRVLSATVGSFMLLPLLPAVWSLDSGYAQLAVLRVPKN